ncbi:MAG TPA: tetratricopeptide repeat protein [Candidatus Obscuribacterales bacterium]
MITRSFTPVFIFALSLICTTSAGANEIPETAQRHLDAGRFKSVIALVDKARANGDKDAELLVLKARALNALKDYKGSLKAADEALSLDGNSARAWHVRAMTNISLNHHEQALKEMERAVKLDPDLTHGHAVVAQLLCNKKRYTKAIAEAKIALKQKPDYADCANIVAFCYEQLKQPARAREALDAQLKLTPTDVATLRHRTLVNTALANWRQVIADCTQVLKTSRQDAMLWHDRGQAYYMLGDPKRAIADLTKSIQLNDKLTHSYALRAAARTKLKQYKDAILDALKALRLQPGFADAYQIRSDCYAALSQDKKVKAADIEKIDPAGYWQFRSIERWKAGDAEGALKAINEAIKLDPKDPHNYYLRGLLYEEFIEDAKALADYEKALTLHPRFVAAGFHKALVAKELGKNTAALASLRKLASMEKGNPYVEMEYAASLKALGKYKEAIAQLNKTLAHHSQELQAYELRAQCRAALRQFDGAIEDWTTCLTFKKSWKFFKHRADCHRALKQYADAINELTKAIALQPIRTSLYRERAKLYEESGKAREAEQDRHRAAELEKGM